MTEPQKSACPTCGATVVSEEETAHYEHAVSVLGFEHQLQALHRLELSAEEVALRNAVQNQRDAVLLLIYHKAADALEYRGYDLTCLRATP